MSAGTLADWCEILLLDEGGQLRRAALAHVDPDREEAALAALRTLPPGKRPGFDIPNPLETGHTAFVPDVSDRFLAAVAADDHFRATIRNLGLRSILLVPLKARGRVLGLLVLVTSEAGHVLGTDEQLLAEELAARAALAIDHARLLEAEREGKRAAQKAAASQERFSKIFRASTVAICVSRAADGRIVDANPACHEQCGFPVEELIGSHIEKLGAWVDLDERRRAYDVLERDGRVRGFPARVRTRSGEVRELLVSLERIEYGGETCVLSIGQDITGMRGLDADRSRAQKMEAIGRLAGGIAHDFNNILTAIHGYTGLLLEALPDGALRADAEHIRRAAARASALANQLLVIGRQKPQQPVVLDPNVAVGNLSGMLERLIGEDIVLETRLAPSLGHVQVDYGQLEQVILNLALNARDAMPRGGRLTIATSRSSLDGAPAIRLSVADTGEGMSEATRAQLFEPFFTTKDVGKGSGLGLSSVYSIVEQARGRIAVESAPGKGARFDLDLPLVPLEETPSQPPGPLPPGALDHETILVVEDDVEVREFVCLVLGLAGYEVLSAASGTQALELVARREGPIDLLLSDVVMPHMNGRELAAALTHARPGVRVLHMSGYPGDTVERYGDIAPGVPFLQKPFTRESLLAKIAEALGTRS